MNTTIDPALTKPTFSNNKPLHAALARIAALEPKPVISGAEVDGSDDQPQEPKPTTQLERVARKVLHYFDTDAEGIHPEDLVKELRAALAGGE